MRVRPGFSRLRVCLSVWLSVWLSAWVCAQSAYAQVEVTAASPWQDRDGYTPIVVTLRADIPSLVELDGSDDSGHGRMTVEVSPGETLRRTVLVPTSGRRWSSSVSLAWRSPGQPPGKDFLSPRNYRDFDVIVIDPAESYPVKELREAVSKKIGSPPDPDSGYRGNTSATYAENRFTRWGADALPDRWQGFPSWITVLVTPAGERALSEAQRGALSAWSMAGGALFVTSPEQIPRWQSLGAQVQVVSASALERRIIAVWNQSGRSSDSAPVPGTNAVPVYGFVTIAVLFAILVGPANLWWCARQGRRHLMLVTTPILSLLASVILLTYGILADGFTVRRSAVQVMALDQISGRVSTWTGMTLFAGLPPSTISLDESALLVPLDPGSSNGRRSDPPAVELDWTPSGQEARGAWIPARANRQLGVGLVSAEKRRLAFTQSGAEWTVANGFDHPLSALHWIDATGAPWHLEQPLAPGQSALMKAGQTGPLHPPLKRLPAAAELAVAAIMSPENTTPGAYVATFESALVPIPGPVVTDMVPVRTWVVGRVIMPATIPKAGF